MTDSEFHADQWLVNGATIKILLVEDEPPLLELVEKYLRRLGFEVETHLTPVDALQSFEAAPHRYGMVIADLGLPDMSGHTLLARMLEIQPSLRILICSGSPFNMEKLPISRDPHVVFLQKPFVPKMLAEAVQRLLKHPPNNPSPTTG